MTNTRTTIRRTDAAVENAKGNRGLIEAELLAIGSNVRGNVCNCPNPVHDDTNPSAGIIQGDDGTWRVNCLACSWRGNVFDLRAIRNGTTAVDEFRAARGSERPKLNSSDSHNPAKRRGKVHPTVEAVERAAAFMVEQSRGTGYTITNRYTYPDGAVVLRFESDEHKMFVPHHATDGGFKVGDPPGKFPLYRRDGLRPGRVVAVEGEKAADALASIGANVVTSAHGSKSAHKADWSPLAGRDVVIWRDADDSGIAYAKAATDILRRLGCTVRTICPDGLVDGEDAHDWIEQRDAIEADDLLAQIESMADAATVELKSDSISDSGSELPQPATDFALTDTGNAELMVAMFGDRIMYVAVWGKWFIYSGVRWEDDSTGQIEQFAKRAVRSLYDRAAKQEDGDKRAKLATWAKASEAANRRAAMIKLAQSEPGIATAPDDLDRDPWLLNTITGTVDLRTGESRPHDPRDLITKLAPVEMSNAETSKCPIYKTFMARIFKDNAALIEYVERLIGYFLTGDIRHHLLPIPWGCGANGKSTLFDLLLYVMGDYAAPAPESLLTARKSDEHPTEIAMLHRLRLVIGSETEEGRKLRISLVKRITGDRELIGRFMRRDLFKFERTHKTVLVTNNRPRVSEDSEAVWRRIRLIPFNVTIPEDERDRALPDKLRAEAPAILARWVAACLRWQRDGYDLAEPAVVTNATDDYRGDEDVLAEFLDDACVVCPEAKVSRGDIWDAYSKWADHERVAHPMGKRTLYERIRQMETVEEGDVPAGDRYRKGFKGIGIALRGQSHD